IQNSGYIKYCLYNFCIRQSKPLPCSYGSLFDNEGKKNEQQIDKLYSVCRGLDHHNTDDWRYFVIEIQNKSV
ncbi:hypothetical protein, partial [Xenorhabdus koppenhoeferi]|uniref:hypothetical protein n=1 Tax=Xenorhabdus koppenhoeferi TaxID=351659 RepID=UPI002B40795B